MDNNNDVNAMFMQNMLRKNKEYDTIIVKGVRVEHACEKGENFASVVLRVHVEGYKTMNSNVEVTIPLIVKRPFQSDAHAMFHSEDMFNNEAIAYNQILPTLQQYLKSPLPTPVCLHADKSWIVLEDLNISGYRMNSNQICMTIDQCSVVLRELAVFHSATVILKAKDPRQIEVLANQIIDTYRSDNNAIADLVDTNITIALQLLRLIEQQTDDIKHVIEVLETHGKNHKIFNRVSELIKTKSDKNVFNHGDCWRNNMLFRELSDGNVDLKLIDLQVMRYTSVAADLCYFLFVNLLPEDRIENTEYFLNLYLNTFHNSLANHGINANACGYNRDWLDEEFRKFSIFGFMCSLLLAPVFYYDKNNLPHMDHLKPDENDPDFHENFILRNMTPELKSRIIAIAIDFAKNY